MSRDITRLGPTTEGAQRARNPGAFTTPPGAREARRRGPPLRRRHRRRAPALRPIATVLSATRADADATGIRASATTTPPRSDTMIRSLAAAASAAKRKRAPLRVRGEWIVGGVHPFDLNGAATDRYFDVAARHDGTLTRRAHYVGARRGHDAAKLRSMARSVGSLRVDGPTPSVLLRTCVRVKNDLAASTSRHCARSARSCARCGVIASW
jgi:hypothetical protein